MSLVATITAARHLHYLQDGTRVHTWDLFPNMPPFAWPVRDGLTQDEERAEITRQLGELEAFMEHVILVKRNGNSLQGLPDARGPTRLLLNHICTARCGSHPMSDK